MSFYTKSVVALFATMSLCGAANAVTYMTAPGAPDTGPAAGQTILVDFNSGVPAGYSLSGSYGIVSTTTSAAAAPAGDSSPYFYTSSALGTGVATLTAAFELKSVSFYWGSVDTYNSVDVLGAGGATLFTLAGSDFSPANGNQTIANTNQRVFFTAGANEVITGLRFASTGIAFELDDVAGTAVPEPATWAMFVVGFGLVGLSVRRRKHVRSVTA